MVMRPRYYCDHCKKAGGSGGHIRRHEFGCTANPNRACGICRENDFHPKPLAELVALCRARATHHTDPTTEFDYHDLDAAALKELREAADGCPACMLAAMRQAPAFASRQDFNFKEELASVWAEKNAERMSRYYGGG